MAEKTESPQDWTRVWLDMQKQYMDTWLNLTRQEMPWGAAQSPFTAGGSNPWTDSFEQWSRLFGKDMPGDSREITERLFDLGKSYLSMSESFWKLMQQHNNGATCNTDWQDLFRNSMEQLGNYSAFPGAATDPWSGFASLWGLPMSNWQRMACALSPFPGEMEKALREDHASQPSEMTRMLRHYLSLPPVGYTREWQEQLQEWSRLSIEYAHAMQEFTALLGRVVQRAQELFGNRMTEKTRAGESFDSLRQVYDLWIDCGEDAYAEQVETAEFPHLQAELVNALMRMKRHEQLMMEEVMTMLNMPTRQEMDSTHKRVYELQRQLRRLEEYIEEGGESETVPEPAPRTRRKATSRKKAVRKTAKKTAKKTATGKARTTTKRRSQPRTRKG